MKIDLFDVEAWMTEYETNYRYNLAETCVASMSINDLLELVENKKGVIDNLLMDLLLVVKDCGKGLQDYTKMVMPITLRLVMAVSMLMRWF